MIRPHSCQIAKLMIWGKLYNGRWSIERTKRDHKLRIDAERFENASAAIRDILPAGHGGGFTRILCVVWRARLRRFTLRYSTI